MKCCFDTLLRISIIRLGERPGDAPIFVRHRSGNIGRHLDEGWNIGGGVGTNFNSYLGAMVHVDYNSLGVNGVTPNSAGFPGGDVHICIPVSFGFRW